MKNRNKYILFLVVGIAFNQFLYAQQSTKSENALFWEVSGKNLKSPSYLFGTFHLLDNRFIDSLTNVKAKLAESKTVVGELLMDSTMAFRIMMAAQLKGTTLDKLISAEDYQKTADWMKELTGYELKMFNNFNPITIQLLLMSSLQQKFYSSNPATDVAMDIYFQKLGSSQGKKVVGLETFDEQIQVIFGQFSYERQAELLSEYVKTKDKAYQEMAELNKYYREQNLSKLEEMVTKYQYDSKESEVLIDNRNKGWMKSLADLMNEQSTFIAVGALHLPGENGLVNLLKKEGYTVRPIKLK